MSAKFTGDIEDTKLITAKVSGFLTAGDDDEDEDEKKVIAL